MIDPTILATFEGYIDDYPEPEGDEIFFDAVLKQTSGLTEWDDDQIYMSAPLTLFNEEDRRRLDNATRRGALFTMTVAADSVVCKLHPPMTEAEIVEARAASQRLVELIEELKE